MVPLFYVLWYFLGALTSSWKAPIIFVMSVHLSARVIAAPKLWRIFDIGDFYEKFID
jgi:hypothetical protein